MGNSMRMKLIQAVKENDVETVDLLLEEGINLSYQDEQGKSALMHASILGRTNFVKKLIYRKAPLNQMDFYGDTALILALHHKQKEIASLLLEAGADVNHINQNGYTPLMFAVETNEPALVQQLLQRKADVNKKAECDYTALMIAAHCGDEKIVSMLVEAGADVFCFDAEGETAYTWAQSAKQTQVIDFLKQKAKEAKMELSFFRAVKQYDKKEVENFIKKGIDVNYQNEAGWTMLMYASFYGYEKIVETLLKAGADITLKDLTGTTAYHLATRNGFSTIAKMIENAETEKKITSCQRNVTCPTKDREMGL